MKLANQVALVTGGARGIGLGIAEALADEGARVVVNALHPESAARGVATLQARGHVAIAAPGDVSSKLDVERIVGAAVDAFGRLDILINNAGVETSSPFLEMAEADFDRIIAVNLKSIFLCSQVAGRIMQRGGGGRIVNITSLCAQQVWRGYAHYCAAKAGADMLTKVMAVELAPLGIRVNAIAPGTVDTELARADLDAPGAQAWIVRRTPAARLGRPEDIARAVIYLVAEGSDWHTGDVLTIDGGYRLLGDPPDVP